MSEEELAISVIKQAILDSHGRPLVDMFTSPCLEFWCEIADLNLNYLEKRLKRYRSKTTVGLK